MFVIRTLFIVSVILFTGCVQKEFTSQSGYVIDPKASAQDDTKNKLLMIRKILQERAKYPFFERLLGHEGIVNTSFRIEADGIIDDIRILKSSGYSTLDNYVIELIKESKEDFPQINQKVTVKFPMYFGSKDPKE